MTFGLCANCSLYVNYYEWGKIEVFELQTHATMIMWTWHIGAIIKPLEMGGCWTRWALDCRSLLTGGWASAAKTVRETEFWNKANKGVKLTFTKSVQCTKCSVLMLNDAQDTPFGGRIPILKHLRFQWSQGPSESIFSISADDSILVVHPYSWYWIPT